jgi:oligosaccharide repeat unit polymerase
MSVTTRNGLGDVNFDDIFSVGIFKIKDVDIFETLTHTVSHVKEHGLYLGDNLLAIFLFFIPRSFWPDKPIVGGLVIGEDLYWGGVTGTPNLSYFIAGDVYMDFGMLGVLCFGCILGCFFSWLTRLNYSVSGHNLVQYFLISSLPILLRGPVGAVIGYPLCLIVFVILINKIVTDKK